MAEDTTTTETTETVETTEQTEDVTGLKSALDKERDARKAAEKRAKDNADAAKRLAEIENAQKTEAEKAAERIKQLEADAADARRDAVRFKVASKFGISDEDAELFLTGSDEETLTKQAERLAAREAERKKNGNFVPREGNNPTSTGDQNEAAFARALFSPRE